MEDFVTVGGLLAVCDDGEFDLLYKGIAGLFYSPLVNLLLIQGSLNTVNNVRDGAIIGVV